MDASPSARDLLESSLPVAVTLLFWAALSWLGSASALSAGARGAGLAMGALAALAAGLALSPSVDPPAWDDPAAVLRANARVAAVVVAWVLVVVVVQLIGQVWARLGIPGLFGALVRDVRWALSWTAVGAGVVYAVAVAASMLRDLDPRDVAPAEGD